MNPAEFPFALLVRGLRLARRGRWGVVVGAIADRPAVDRSDGHPEQRMSHDEGADRACRERREKGTQAHPDDLHMEPHQGQLWIDDRDRERCRHEREHQSLDRRTGANAPPDEEGVEDGPANADAEVN